LEGVDKQFCHLQISFRQIELVVVSILIIITRRLLGFGAAPSLVRKIQAHNSEIRREDQQADPRTAINSGRRQVCPLVVGLATCSVYLNTINFDKIGIFIQILLTQLLKRPLRRFLEMHGMLSYYLSSWFCDTS